jgi:K+-transporting ATPase A subunit
MYGMLVMVVLTVFIAGLMVGRTPEYRGKKIEAKDVKLAMLYVLVFALSILCLSSVVERCSLCYVEGQTTAGRTVCSRIIYAFVSCTGNNGSAFGGLTVKHLLVRHDAWTRDIDRPLPDDHSDDGNRGQSGGEEDRASFGRYIPGPHASFC